jgi:hypothetical protein
MSSVCNPEIRGVTMKKLLTMIVLSVLVLVFRSIHGQSPDCRDKCKHKKTECDIQCIVSDPGSNECTKQCEKESATCLGSCQKVKPDNNKSGGDDSDYDADDDDGDSDIDNDFDKDDFFKEKKK